MREAVAVRLSLVQRRTVDNQDAVHPPENSDGRRRGLECRLRSHQDLHTIALFDMIASLRHLLGGGSAEFSCASPPILRCETDTHLGRTVAAKAHMLRRMLLQLARSLE